jgi:cyclopropane-fatty-acyl-phospholipid synthase
LCCAGNVERIVGKLRTNSSSASSLVRDAADVQHHYDVGNEFYASFLTDRLMAYTCGFFMCPDDSLDRAQHNKVDRIVAKLDARPGDRVLDVGCSWGRVAAYVAQRTGAHVTGTSVALEQLEYIRRNVPSELVEGVECHHMEMAARLGEGAFDRAFSIGMFEHVRCSNYDTFFFNAAAVLRPGGRFLLHTISTNRDDTSCG